MTPSPGPPPLAANGTATGSTSTADPDFFFIDVAQGGHLRATLAATGGTLDPRLELLDANGIPLVASDDLSASDPRALIEQSLTPGRYYLRVSAQSGTGTYLLTTDFAYGAATSQLPGQMPADAAVADVTGDGVSDVLFADSAVGTVSVRVGRGDGTFVDGQNVAVGPAPSSLAVGDLDGAGGRDIATVNGDGTVSVRFNDGTGRFASGLELSAADALPPGTSPTAVAYLRNGAGGAGFLIVAAQAVDGTGQPTTDPGVVLVLRYNAGTMTFDTVGALPVGIGPQGLVIGDIDGDGNDDLAVLNRLGDTINLFTGDGAGGFTPSAGQSVISGAGGVTFLGPDTPVGVGGALVDLDGVNGADLVVTGAPTATFVPNSPLRQISVFLRQADGTFGPAIGVPTGQTPVSVATGDYNGDGIQDLAIAAFDSDAVNVRLGRGDGTFINAGDLAVGFTPISVKVADVNRDGVFDLVVANQFGGNVGVYLGRGDGSFVGLPGVPTGTKPVSIGTADFDRNGTADFVTANFNDGTVSVRLGRGDGSFTVLPPVVVGNTASNPSDVAVGDLNRDGRPDFVVAVANDNSVAVRLGNGDGTFTAPFTAPSLGRAQGVGTFPTSVTLADVNRDGILDLVVANSGLRAPDAADPTKDTVTVYLGRGDGTFTFATRFHTGQTPVKVKAADINGDGINDLIVANINEGSQIDGAGNVLRFGGSVSLHLGNGDGTFRAGGNLPLNPAAGDFGPFDLAVTRTSDGRPVVSVSFSGLRERGDQFVGDAVFSGAKTVGIFVGDGRGGFVRAGGVFAGDSPRAMNLSDTNRDGQVDTLFVSDNFGRNVYAFSLANGQPQPANALLTGIGLPIALANADVDGSGQADLFVALDSTNTVRVVPDPLSASLTFDPLVESQRLGGAERRSTPFVAPVDASDLLPDAVTLDSLGRILVRRSVDPAGGLTLLSPNVPNAGRAARDITLFRDGGPRSLIAAADSATFTRAGSQIGTVSVYRSTGVATFSRTTAFEVPGTPTRVAARDLNGDSRDDLVVVSDDRGFAFVTIALQRADGGFDTVVRSTGAAGSEVAFADLDGDTRPDVLVSAGGSGDVTVLYNDASAPFANQRRYRAGAGPFGLLDGTNSVSSANQTISLATDFDFTGDGLPDVVVINRGLHQFSLLVNNGDGGLVNPQPADTLSTADALPTPLANVRPGPVVVGNFNGDAFPDLAVLVQDRGEVWVYRGTARGLAGVPLVLPAVADRYSVGSDPSGLRVQDVTSEFGGGPDGKLDLLVSNPSGDLLVLAGRGDGSFAIVQRATGDIPLDVRDQGNGTVRAAVASQTSDRVTVQAAPQSDPGLQTVFQRIAGLGPSAVRIARLDSDAIDDLVVTLRDSNRVQVYRGLGNDQFAAPVEYVVGTGPVDVLVTDLDRDGIPDLVTANGASNDLTVLRGHRTAGGAWFADPNTTRVSTVVSPVSVSAGDRNGDGLPEVLATGADGSVRAFANRGQGFISAVGTALLGGIAGNVSTGGRVVGDRSIQVFDDGRAFAVNLADGTRTQLPVGAATAANLVALADGTFAAVVGSAGGTFSVFRTDAAGAFQFNGAVSAPDLSDPSALQILERANGLLDIYTTTEGVERAFLLQFTLPDAFVITPTLADTAASVVVPVGQQALATVLLFTLFPGGDPFGPAPSEVLDPFEAFLPVGAVADFASDGGGGGSGVDEELSEVAPPEESALPAWQQLVAGLGELVEWLKEEGWDETVAVVPPQWRGLLELTRAALLAGPALAALGSGEEGGSTEALAVPETTATVAEVAAAEVVTAEVVVGVAEQDGVRSWWPTAGGAAVAGLVPPAFLLLARFRRERRKPSGLRQ